MWVVTSIRGGNPPLVRLELEHSAAAELLTGEDYLLEHFRIVDE